MLTLADYSKRRRTVDDMYLGGLLRQPQRTKPVATPVVDSDDAIGSLANILGPSPEEKEAEENRLAEHKRKMQGWAGLFNGLRHLSNLYYTVQGAPGQKYGDPHALIDKQYDDERKRLANIQDYSRTYYQNVYTLQRQAANDALNREMLQQKNQRENAQALMRMQLQQAQMERQQALAAGDAARAAEAEARINRIYELLPYEIQDKQASVQQRRASAASSYANAHRATVQANSEDDSEFYSLYEQYPALFQEYATNNDLSVGTNAGLGRGGNWSDKRNRVAATRWVKEHLRQGTGSLLPTDDGGGQAGGSLLPQ